MVGRKAAAPVHHLCGYPARLPHAFDEIEQRLVTFRQVAKLCGPVVHLSVDIDRKFTVPRRRETVVPDALQVRW